VLAVMGAVAGFTSGLQHIQAESQPANPKVHLPFYVYSEKGSVKNHYCPSGWMGHTKAIKLDEGCGLAPHSGKTCLRCEYSELGGWGGVAWQYPANDWGDLPDSWNLTGATNLSFWARGEKGNEMVTFEFGILGPNKKYPDSDGGEIDFLKLTSDWKEYNIELNGKNLSRIKTGFAWTVTGQGEPVVFYLDDIQFQ